MKNPYEVLGITIVEGELKNIPHSHIQRVYRLLRSQWHPDRNSAPEAPARMAEIQVAYDVLSDTVKRAEYDATGTVKADSRDNDALQFIRGKMLELVNADGFNPVVVDLVGDVAKLLQHERLRAVQFLADVERKSVTLDTTANRMKSKRGDNFMAAMLQQELTKTGKMREATESAIRVLDRALEIVNDHEFDFTRTLRFNRMPETTLLDVQWALTKPFGHPPT